MEKATPEKLRLEEKQRIARRLRKEQGIEWENLWFGQVKPLVPAWQSSLASLSHSTTLMSSRDKEEFINPFGYDSKLNTDLVINPQNSRGCSLVLAALLL